MLALGLVVLTGLMTVAPAAAQTDFGRPGGPFRVEWILERAKSGAPRLSGYVHNEYGRPVNRVRLLVEAFDQSSRVADQRYQWLPGAINPFGRAYFEVEPLPPGERYRVTVHSYNILDDSPLRDPFR
jgi:hypothetical protein